MELFSSGDAHSRDGTFSDRHHVLLRWKAVGFLSFPLAEFSSGSYNSELSEIVSSTLCAVAIKRTKKPKKPHCMLSGRILRTRQQESFGCYIKRWRRLGLMTASARAFAAEEGRVGVREGTEEGRRRCLTARAMTARTVRCGERRQRRGLIKIYKIMEDRKLLLTRSHSMRRHLMKTAEGHF